MPLDDLALARAIHILALVHWIGGVAVVTTIVLPRAYALPDVKEAVAAFEAFEQRFRVSGPRFDSARRAVRRLHADKGRCLVSPPRTIVLVVTAHDRCLGSIRPHSLCARTARASPSFSRICSA